MLRHLRQRHVEGNEPYPPPPPPPPQDERVPPPPPPPPPPQDEGQPPPPPRVTSPSPATALERESTNSKPVFQHPFTMMISGPTGTVEF